MRTYIGAVMPGRSHQLRHLPECIGHTGLLLPSDINYCMTFSDICQSVLDTRSCYCRRTSIIAWPFRTFANGLPKHFQRDKLISVSIKNLKTDEIQRSNKKHLWFSPLLSPLLTDSIPFVHFYPSESHIGSPFQKLSEVQLLLCHFLLDVNGSGWRIFFHPFFFRNMSHSKVPPRINHAASLCFILC